MKVEQPEPKLFNISETEGLIVSPIVIKSDEGFVQRLLVVIENYQNGKRGPVRIVEC